MTGASAGIGAATARACAGAGARVAGLARRVERLVALRDEALAEPAEVTHLEIALLPTAQER